MRGEKGYSRLRDNNFGVRFSTPLELTADILDVEF